MDLLLDSHALIWWVGDQDLDAPATRRMSDPATRVFVSAATVWEITIKEKIGKLRLDGDLLAEIGANGFEPLPISLEHGRAAGALPLHHRDPFDRLLVAQAQIEGLTLVTRDPKLDAYEVDILPC